MFPHCTKKMKFCIKNFLNKCDQNPQLLADLVTFAEEILNVELLFLYCALYFNTCAIGKYCNKREQCYVRKLVTSSLVKN